MKVEWRHCFPAQGKTHRPQSLDYRYPHIFQWHAVAVCGVEKSINNLANVMSARELSLCAECFPRGRFSYVNAKPWSVDA